MQFQVDGVPGGDGWAVLHRRLADGQPQGADQLVLANAIKVPQLQFPPVGGEEEHKHGLDCHARHRHSAQWHTVHRLPPARQA